MNREDIVRMARQAGVRDDEQRFEFSEYKYLEFFAELVAQHQREKDREQAVTLLRQLHDSFSLESAELRIHQWASKERA